MEGMRGIGFSGEVVVEAQQERKVQKAIDACHKHLDTPWEMLAVIAELQEMVRERMPK